MPTITDLDESRCACGNVPEKGDLYCRICGRSRGAFDYSPANEIMECIYGPAPVINTRKCRECGLVYEIALVMDDSTVCPRCGGETDIDEMIFDW